MSVALQCFSNSLAYYLNNQTGAPPNPGSEITQLQNAELYVWILDTLEKRSASKGGELYQHCLLGTQLSNSAIVDAQVASMHYFEAVLNQPIKNPRNLTDTPTIRLAKLLYSHRVTPAAIPEFPAETSLWDILAQATTPINGKPIQFRRWHQETEFFGLCKCLLNVLSTANRHYGELYRIGVYPPDWMKDINVSQARKINLILAPLHDYRGKLRQAKANGCDLSPDSWIDEARHRWDADKKYRINKLLGKKISNFDDFLNTDLISRLSINNTVGHSVDFALEENHAASSADQTIEESDVKDILAIIRCSEELHNTDKLTIENIVSGRLSQHYLEGDIFKKRCRELKKHRDNYILWLVQIIEDLLETE